MLDSDVQPALDKLRADLRAIADDFDPSEFTVPDQHATITCPNCAHEMPLTIKYGSD